jgi:hypothetical protein
MPVTSTHTTSVSGLEEAGTAAASQERYDKPYALLGVLATTQKINPYMSQTTSKSYCQINNIRKYRGDNPIQDSPVKKARFVFLMKTRHPTLADWLTMV